MNASDVARLPRAALMDLLLAGHAIEADALAGRDYDGTSLGLPGFVERLTWKRFRKSFRRDDAGRIAGYNVRIDNARPGFCPMLEHGTPITFGPFVVVPADGHPMPRPATRGLLLDYSDGGRRRGPLARLRDPLVALNPGDASLLLGWTYLDLGLTQVATPSFFTLELHR